jgi:hypothetical protein
MRTRIRSLLFVALFATVLPAAPVGADDAPAAKTEPEFTREDFGIGRKHTGNDWCNRKVDELLEKTRQCFNTRPDKECDAVQKANSKKMGVYLRSPRCIKQRTPRR